MCNTRWWSQALRPPAENFPSETKEESCATFLSISIDGVIQAPGKPDEDTPGWLRPVADAQYNDEVMAQRMGEGMASSGAMLFGRRTYKDFYGYWPTADRQPVHAVLESVGQVRRLEHALRAASVAEPDLASWRSSGSAERVSHCLRRSSSTVCAAHPPAGAQGDRLFDECGPGVDFELAEAWSRPRA